MCTNYQVKGEWVQTDSGRVYVAKAISEKGRILGVVRAEVPIEIGYDLATIYGNRLSEQMIVEAVEEQAHLMGEAASQTS